MSIRRRGIPAPVEGQRPAGDPRILEGGRALLFDRLVDLHPDDHSEPRPLRTMDREELKDSVRREVARLLNTRCGFPAEALEGRERTVLEYGLPDCTHLHTRDPGAQRALTDEVARTVTAFEPRLRQVKVAVEPLRNSQRELLVRVDALLVAGDVVEAVSFPVSIGDASHGAAAG